MFFGMGNSIVLSQTQQPPIQFSILWLYIQLFDIICHMLLFAVAFALGAAVTDEYGIIYENEQKTTIVGYDNSIFCGLLPIPDSVTAIAAFAFQGCHFADSIVIPSGVKHIGTGAFKNSRGRTISFEGDGKTLGEFIFDGASFKKVLVKGNTLGLSVKTFSNVSLEVLRFECNDLVLDGLHSCQVSDLEVYGAHVTLGEKLFETATVKQITIGATDVHVLGPVISDIVFDGATLAEVAARAFAGVNTRGQWTFAESIEKLNKGIFARSVQEVKVVEIPKNVKEIDGRAFVGASGIEGFNVNADNQGFAAVGGAVYSKDMTKLVLFPPALNGEYDLPAEVTEVQVGALAGNRLSAINVPENNTNFVAVDGVLFSSDKAKVIAAAGVKESVTLENVKEISEYAFAVDALKKVSVSSTEDIVITENAFAHCPSLQTVDIKSDKKVSIDDAFAGSAISETFTIKAQEVVITGLIGNGYCKKLDISGNVWANNPFADSPSSIGTISVGQMTLLSLPPGHFAGFNLEGSLTFGDSITMIPVGAFADQVGLSGKIVFKGAMSFIGYDAFRGCKKITEFVLEKPGNFQSAGGIVYNTLTGDVTLFPLGATATMTITKNMTISSARALSGAACQQFAVAGEGNKYTVVDGILYTKDNSVLVACPSGLSSDVKVAKETVTIGEYAFAESHAKSVDLGTVQEIGEHAFAHASVSALEVKGNDCRILRNAFRKSAIKALILSGNGFNISFEALNEMHSLEKFEVSGSNGAFAPRSVTRVQCTNVTVSGSGIVIPSQAFDSCTITNFAIQGADTVVEPTAITNTNLKTLTLSGTLTVEGPIVGPITGRSMLVAFDSPQFVAVGDYAFGGLAMRGSVNFKEGIERIGASAFTWTRGIGISDTVIKFPTSLKEVSANAFEGISLVKELYFDADSLVLGDRSFAACKGLKDVWFKAEQANVEGVNVSFVDIDILPTFHFGSQMEKDKGMMIGVGIAMTLIGLSIIATVIVCVKRRTGAHRSIDSMNRSLFDE